MKNKSLKSILIGCLLLFVLSSNAQIKILTIPDSLPGGELPILGTIINGGNLVPEEDFPSDYTLGENCEEYFSFTVLVANLVEGNVDNKSLSLPASGYEAMALRLTIGGETGCIDLNDFEPYDTPQGYNLFQSTVLVPIDLRTYCKVNKLGNPINDSFFLEWSAEIILADGADCEGAYELYPFCNYTDPGSLYPCDVFSLGENCPLLPGSCSNEELTSFGNEFLVLCGDCKENGGIVIVDEPPVELPTVKDEIKRVGSEQENEFLISPNPFTTLLNVQWSGESTALSEVTLRNVNGRIIRHWSMSEMKNSQSIQIDTKELPVGIYIATFRNEHGTYAQKIIKH